MAIQVVLLLGLVAYVATLANVGGSKVFDELLSHGYSKDERPSSNSTTQDRVGVYISHSEINVEKGVLFLDTYFRQSWKDPRLARPDGSDKIRLMDGWEKIWVPDYFIRNAKDARIPYNPTPQRLMTLKADGTVWYVHRAQWELYCPALKRASIVNREFNCSWLIESFGYTMDTLYFSWLDSPVDINPSVLFDGFTLTDTHLFDCSQNYTAGAFPCLKITFQFKKHLLHKRSVERHTRDITGMDIDCRFCSPHKMSWLEHKYEEGRASVITKRYVSRQHPSFYHDDNRSD